MTLNDLEQILFQHQDAAYADFTAKLIPTVPREKFIGIRSPEYKNYETCVSALEQFMPYIDNWAVNDTINPTCFRKHRAELIHRVQAWISSPAPYTRRCGMRVLMANYLDQDFRPEYLSLPADLRSDEYYVNIMTAWLFAEALVKQWDTAVTFIETRRLDPWTHNKTIQKACESYRIPDERKAYLRTLKIRNTKEKGIR